MKLTELVYACTVEPDFRVMTALFKVRKRCFERRLVYCDGLGIVYDDINQSATKRRNEYVIRVVRVKNEIELIIDIAAVEGQTLRAYVGKAETFRQSGYDGFVAKCRNAKVPQKHKCLKVRALSKGNVHGQYVFALDYIADQTPAYAAVHIRPIALQLTPVAVELDMTPAFVSKVCAFIFDGGIETEAQRDVVRLGFFIGSEPRLCKRV